MVRDLPLFVKLLVPAALILALTIVGDSSGEERRNSSATIHRDDSHMGSDTTTGEEVSYKAGTATGEGVPAGSTARGSAQGRPGEVNRRSGGGHSANGAGIGGAATNTAGDRIAFVEGGEIYVMSLDGSGKTGLGPGSDPDWSPDGSEILFTLGGTGGGCAVSVRTAPSPDPCEIWVMRSDGSNRRFVAPGLQPDWSPDGNRIAYAWGQGDSEIYVMNADGSGSTQLTQTPERAHTPDWSPDGSRLIFTRREKCGEACWDTPVYVMNADGSGLNKLSNLWGAGDALWSPDGAHVAFSGVPAGNGDNWEIFTMRSDGSELVRLTQDARAGSPMDNFDGLPAWSRDARIIFTRDADGPTGWGSCYYFYGQANCGTGGPALPELFLMNSDGSGRVRIGPGIGATFAPRQR